MVELLEDRRNLSTPNKVAMYAACIYISNHTQTYGLFPKVIEKFQPLVDVGMFDKVALSAKSSPLVVRRKNREIADCLVSVLLLYNAKRLSVNSNQKFFNVIQRLLVDLVKEDYVTVLQAVLIDKTIKVWRGNVELHDMIGQIFYKFFCEADKIVERKAQRAYYTSRGVFSAEIIRTLVQHNYSLPLKKLQKELDHSLDEADTLHEMKKLLHFANVYGIKDTKFNLVLIQKMSDLTNDCENALDLMIERIIGYRDSGPWVHRGTTHLNRPGHRIFYYDNLMKRFSSVENFLDTPHTKRFIFRFVFVYQLISINSRAFPRAVAEKNDWEDMERLPVNRLISLVRHMSTSNLYMLRSIVSFFGHPSRDPNLMIARKNLPWFHEFELAVYRRLMELLELDKSMKGRIRLRTLCSVFSVYPDKLHEITAEIIEKLGKNELNPEFTVLWVKELNFRSDQNQKDFLDIVEACRPFNASHKPLLNQYILFSFGSDVYYKPPETLSDEILELLFEDTLSSSVNISMNAALWAISLGKLKKSHVEAIFNKEFLQKFDNDFKFGSKKSASHQTLVRLNRLVHNLYPEFEVPWFNSHIVKEMAAPMRNSVGTPYDDIALMALGGHKFVKEDFNTPYGTPIFRAAYIDPATYAPVEVDGLHLDAHGRPTSLTDRGKFDKLIPVALDFQKHWIISPYLQGRK